MRCCTFVALLYICCAQNKVLLYLHRVGFVVVFVSASLQSDRENSSFSQRFEAVVDSSSINMFLINLRNKDFEEKVT